MKERTQTWGHTSQGILLTTGSWCEKKGETASSEGVTSSGGFILKGSLLEVTYPTGVQKSSCEQTCPFSSASLCRLPCRLSPTRIWGSWEAHTGNLQSRTRFILSYNYPTKLGGFSIDIIVEIDTFSQQVPQKHPFQVKKLGLDCMGWKRIWKGE